MVDTEETMSVEEAPSTAPPTSPPKSSVSLVPSLLLVLILTLTLANEQFHAEIIAQMASSQRIYEESSIRLSVLALQRKHAIETLQSDLANARYKIGVLSNQERTLSDMLKRSETTNNDLRNEFERDKAQLEGESVEFQKSSISYQRKMGDANQKSFEKYIASEGSLKNLEVAHARLADQYNSLVQAFNTLRGTYDTALRLIDGLNSELGEIKSSYSGLQYSYNQLQGNYESLRVRANEIAAEAERVSQEYSNLQQQYNRLLYAYRSRGGY